MLFCPDCNHYLTKREILTEGKGLLEIDHCSFCGGSFFDEFEINRLSYKEALKIYSENAQPHRTPFTGSGCCPKCNLRFERLAGEAIPSHVFVMTCPKCHGTWFPPKQLSLFKDAQKAKIDYFKKWLLPLPSLNSVFIQVALFAVLIGAALFSVSKIKESREMRSRAFEAFSYQPFVSFSEDKSKATIIFTTKKEAKSEIVFYYQKPFGKITLPISKEPTTLHQVTITDLQMGKTYYYRLKILTGEQSLTTEEFLFVVK